MLKYVAVLAGSVLVVAGLHLRGDGCPGARVLALVGLSAEPGAVADDKKDEKDKPALSGSWVKKGGELKIEFADKGVMKVYPHGTDVFVLVCEYTRGKEGAVQVKITGFEGKDEAKKKAQELLPVGTEFRFKWKAKGDAATLDFQKGDEHLKSHLEGEYEQKK
jgi:hypothetical protein